MQLTIPSLKKIAIAGRANSGKNTIAQLLANRLCNHPKEYATLAFADPIKESLLLMCPWADPECLYGSSQLRNQIIPNMKNKFGEPLTYRQALIDIGTLGRTYKPDIWVDVMHDRIQKLPLIEREGIQKKLLMITDLRFINEMTYLREQNFFIIKVMRDTPILINHGTETEQEKIPASNFDYVLDNNSNLDDLRIKVSKIPL
jgi:dephospho-CoA kinase